MTMTDDRPAIPDEEIRDWARAAGRKVPERGKVGAALRGEYEKHVADMGAGVDAGDPPGGSERTATRPKPAAAERRPRPPAKPAGGALGRARAWFNGATTTTTGGKKVTTPKAKSDRPRTPVTRLVERGWASAARLAEHVNVPVARTMAWQAPYVGIVVEDVIAATPLDKVLQPFARAETAISGVGSMIAMPLIVGAITAERNDPDQHGLAAVVRQQLLQQALEECIDAQLEMFGSRDLVAKIQKSAEQQAARSEEIDRIRSMIFADLPPVVNVPEDATPAQMAAAREQAAQNAAAEQAMREAAAAVKFMPKPSSERDPRGDEAERAAAHVAAAAQAAAQAQAAAVMTAATRSGWPTGGTAAQAAAAAVMTTGGTGGY